MKITEELLKNKGACEEQCELFALFYPDGVVITEAECVAHARDFDWDWAALHLLPDSAGSQCRAAHKPIDDEYRAARKPIDDEYYAACKPIDDEYLAARKPIDDEYRAAHKPIDDEYYAARKPIDDEYYAARARTFARLALEQ